MELKRHDWHHETPHTDWTYWEPAQATIAKQAAEISRLKAENERLNLAVQTFQIDANKTGARIAALEVICVDAINMLEAHSLQLGRWSERLAALNHTKDKHEG